MSSQTIGETTGGEPRLPNEGETEFKQNSERIFRGQKMNGKPVLYRENARTVLNMKNEFVHKLLCTGPVLNLGDACGFSCSYCYVEGAMRKLVKPILTAAEKSHAEVVIRRRDAGKLLREQLAGLSETEKRKAHVVYSSSLVDIAANLELMKESAEAFTVILEETAWDIRQLTKSALLPKLVELIPTKFHHRLILGVSSGTFDDAIGKIIEKGTAPVSKRIETLSWLQDNGFRTFAMVCPSLPQKDYHAFAEQAAKLLRYDRCEEIWAEVINVRGDSFTRTIAALDAAGLTAERDSLALVCGPDSAERWEQYARDTFEAHAKIVTPEKLRFLQYVERKENVDYWNEAKARGAVLLGRYSSENQRVEVIENDAENIRKLIENNTGIAKLLKRRVTKMMGTWLDNAVTIGEYFAKNKERVGHGRYLSWLTSNFKIDPKTAGNYMVVAAQAPAVREALKSGIVPDFTTALAVARKADRLGNEDDDNEAVIDVEAPSVEILKPEEDGADAQEVPEEVGEPALPVVVGTLPEEAVEEIRAIFKKYASLNFQIIWPTGERKLNDSLARMVQLLC